MKNKFLILLFICFIHLNLYSSETLTFSKAYNLALQNSKEIKALDYKLKIDYENIVQARSKRYPELNFYSSYTKDNYKFNNSSINSIKQEVRDYNFVLHQTIFDKTIDSQIKAEKSKHKSLNAEIDGMKQKIANDILNLYLSLIESKNKIRKLLVNIKKNQYAIQLAQEQYNMNLLTKTDVLKIEVELNQAKIDLEKEKFIYKQNKEKLQIIMGTDINFRVPDLNNILHIVNNTHQLKKVIQSDPKIYSNLQVKKLINIIKMYQYQVKTNQYNHLPKLDLSLTYTKNVDVKNNLSFDSSFDEDKEIALNLVIPLYKGGYFDSKTKASKLNVKASQEELNDLTNQLEYEYKENKNILLWSIKATHLFENSLSTAITSRDTIKKEYNNGLKSIIDLLEAEYEIFEIKEKSISNISTMINAYISILILTNSFENLKVIDLILKD